MHTCAQQRTLEMFPNTSDLNATELKNLTIPLGLVSNGPLIDRAYKEAIPQQYNRELVCNALEAGATDIQICPDWLHIAECIKDGETPVYRYCIIDNGRGMSAEELERYFNNISASGHDLQLGNNFGVGAKISMLPWNPEGLVVMSWTKNNPEGSMIRIIKRKTDGNYGLWMWRDEQGVFQKVGTAPSIYKDKYLPHSSSGTIVIALGMHNTDDTYNGPQKQNIDDINADSRLHKHLLFLNSRFFSVPQKTNIRLAVLAKTDKNLWPKTDISGISAGFFWNYVKGAEYGLDRMSLQKGVLNLATANVHWWICDPANLASSYFVRTSFIGALFNNEIYNTQLGKGARSRYTQFGILFEEVKKRLVLLVEPTQGLNSIYYPNTARSALVCAATDNLELPWAQWGADFAANMPLEIKALCDQYSQPADTKLFKNIKERLKDFLPRLLPTFVKTNVLGTDTLSGLTVPVLDLKAQAGTRETVNVSSSSHKTLNTVQGNGATGKKANPRTEPPTPVWVAAQDMSDESTAAEYVSAFNQIKINKDFFLFNEVLKHWLTRYPDIPALEDKLMLAIKDVYQLKLICGVMQAYSMATQVQYANTWREFITPHALTSMLLGLVNEHALIQQRLNGLGIKQKND